MFIQVIKGRTTDKDALRQRHDAWRAELKPGATGYLGATAGVGADSTFVTLARFESEEAARQNSDRPEQGQWWAETEKLLEDVTFTDSTDVDVFLGGGSNDAGFVQVMIGRAKDKARFQAWERDHEDDLKRLRPDLLGGVRVWDGDRFVDTAYFTSEAEAREGEKKMDGEPALAEWQSLVDDMTFIDLTDPWLD
jgi:hypothetical protein